MKEKSIKELQRQAHFIAREKGFWDCDDELGITSVAAKLALIHSEVSEALEECRKLDTSIYDSYYILSEGGKPEGFGVELADIIIRCLDLAEATGNDMSKLIEIKMQYNKSRPFMNGKRI